MLENVWISYDCGVASQPDGLKFIDASVSKIKRDKREKNSTGDKYTKGKEPLCTLKSYSKVKL